MRSRRARISLALMVGPLLWASGACSAPEDETEGGPALDEALVVGSAQSGAWGDETPWQVEEVFRVGGLSSDFDSQLGRVASLDVNASGHVLVLDGQAQRLKVFNPDGTLLRTIGRPGEGPGEFSADVSGVFERSDSIWILDQSGSGLQAFDLSGDLLGSIRTDPTGIPLRSDEALGRIVAQIRSISSLEDTGSPGTDVIRTIDGGYVDTLAFLSVGGTLRVEGDRPVVMVFASEPFWDMAADGSIAYGASDVYQIKVRGPEGAIDRIVERNVAPIRVTDGVENRLRRAIRERIELMGESPEVIDLMMEFLNFAEHLPFITAVILEDDGHLWVRTSQAPGRDLTLGFDPGDLGSLSDDLSSPLWDVFDPEGSYLGQVELPTRFRPFRMLGDTIWGIQRDDLDVESVVGLRIAR